jgi:hypothetical protein
LKINKKQSADGDLDAINADAITADGISIMVRCRRKNPHLEIVE